MPSWYIKAGLQGALSLLPQPQRWNYVLQRHITGRLHLNDSYFESRLAACRQHIENIAFARQTDRPPPTVLELGTGWHPMVPVGLYLCGVDQITSVDVTPLTAPHLLAETLDFFVRYADEDRLREHLPTVQPDRVETLRAVQAVVSSAPLDDLFGRLHIKTVVTDARSLPYPDNSIGVFVSNTTLEHIPPDVIAGIFREFRRVGGASALMSHLIDLSDHYSGFDRTITPYHFLRYPPGRWRWFNNQLQFQNRLRVSDYRRLHHDNGFDIIREDNRTGTPEQVAQVTQMQLADMFKHYTHDDLIVTASGMVSVAQPDPLA